MVIKAGPDPLCPKAQALVEPDRDLIARADLQGKGLHSVRLRLLHQGFQHFSGDSPSPVIRVDSHIADLALFKDLLDAAEPDDGLRRKLPSARLAFHRLRQGIHPVRLTVRRPRQEIHPVRLTVHRLRQEPGLLPIFLHGHIVGGIGEQEGGLEYAPGPGA